MEAEAQLVNIGTAIDRLVTTEMRVSEYSRGVIGPLYDAAVETQGGGPLSLRAAQYLLAAVHSGDVVFIVTGGGNADFLPLGETDGPPGAVSIANALIEACQAVPFFFTEPEFVENLTRTALAGGIGARTPEVARRVPGTAAFFPVSQDDGAGEEASRYIDEHHPVAVIAIEKVGPNEAGVAHTASGLASDSTRARAEALVEMARSQGILTVGIGDNGNELGFGLISDAVRAHKPYGRVCRCPCGSGLASATVADVLFPVNISNWGGYALRAAVSALVGRPEVMQTPAEELRVIEACVEYGAADGSSGRHVMLVDGTPLDVQLAVVTLLRTIVTNGLVTRPARRF